MEGDKVINQQAFEDSLANLIKNMGYKCGVGQLPNDTTVPYCMITRVPSGPSTGGMASDAEMAEVIYMIKTTGLSTSQAGAVMIAINTVIETGWRTLSGIMGPPRFAPLGLTMEQGDLANASENITFMIGG
jgi:hypothetical protein